MKRESEVIRVTEQQFEECKEANDKGVEYGLEAKEGKLPSLHGALDQSRGSC